MEKKSADGLQGLMVVLSVPFGVVPLVRVLIFDNPVGRALSWFPGTEGHPGDWLVPGVFLVVCLAAVAGLEAAKEKG